MTKFILADMPAKEAAEAIGNRKMVIIPVGAMHKHGDGPLGADMLSCTELARRGYAYMHITFDITHNDQFNAFAQTFFVPEDERVSVLQTRFVEKDARDAYMKFLARDKLSRARHN